ncbi:MAG: glycosyltransferase family 2 protein [Chloroflexota bacterium]
MSTHPDKQSLMVVIPALNEVSTIGAVLDEIPYGDLSKRGYEVKAVVIDNGSIDGTSDVAQQRGAQVIVEPLRGKGHAVRRAFREITGDYLFLIDGDATYPATHIPEMLSLLEDGTDVVLGSRLTGPRAPGSISRFNVIGNRLLTVFACALFHTRTTDLCTGLWGFRGTVPANLVLTARGFNIEAEMYAEVVRCGYRYGEVPIAYRRRPTPTKLRAIRDGWRIARMLVKKRFERRRDR